MVKEPTRRRGWIFFGLGCIALGVVADQIIKEGWNAVALSVVVIFGKYLLGKIGAVFFDGEWARLKQSVIGGDPVKQAIWHSHRRHRHKAKFRDCLEPGCII